MTNPPHAHFADWDAAYVLGALSPADRRDFEDHLEECERCRSAVSELSALPGLLGRIDDARAFALLEEADAVDTPAPAAEPETTTDLVRRIRTLERGRRVRRLAIGIGGLAAAAALASALTLAIPAALHLGEPPAPDAGAELVPADGQSIPIDAFVRLSSTTWGTSIEMHCSYRAGGTSYGSVPYSLWVVGTDGTERPVSDWSSAPGSDVLLNAATALPVDDIDHVDLRTEDGSAVLLTGDVTRYDD